MREKNGTIAPGMKRLFRDHLEWQLVAFDVVQHVLFQESIVLDDIHVVNQILRIQHILLAQFFDGNKRQNGGARILLILFGNVNVPRSIAHPQCSLSVMVRDGG